MGGGGGNDKRYGGGVQFVRNPSPWDEAREARLRRQGSNLFLSPNQSASQARGENRSAGTGPSNMARQETAVGTANPGRDGMGRAIGETMSRQFERLLPRRGIIENGKFVAIDDYDTETEWTHLYGGAFNNYAVLEKDNIPGALADKLSRITAFNLDAGTAAGSTPTANRNYQGRNRTASEKEAEEKRRAGQRTNNRDLLGRTVSASNVFSTALTGRR
jgi:hypothetical protein